MIYHLSAAVDADLYARKFPYRVTCDEQIKRHRFDPGVVFERDREAGDAIDPPIATKGNPKAPFVRKVAGSFTVYARSPKRSASAWDHEDECDRVADGVLSAMHRILKERRLPLEVTASRLLTAKDFNPDDVTKYEQWPGAACRVSFTVTTLVRDVDYANEGADTGVVFDTQAPLVTSADFPDFDPVAG
jgi:hypothetical protein